MQLRTKRRSERRIMGKEVTAIKKMRLLRGLSRKAAAPLVGVTFKLIEQLENGRVELTKSRIEKYRVAYGFSQNEFVDICEGRLTNINKASKSAKPKVINNLKLRRSYQRNITKEATVLIALRKLRGLTQYQASRVCDYSRATIGHIENGRIELAPSRINYIVESYGFTERDFKHHMKAEQLITDVQEECVCIIEGLSEDKLKVVHSFLRSYQ